MNPEDIAALVERLEAAKEGSRELDKAIDAFLHGDQWHNLAYSTSLDAALTLVPEGWLLKELGEWWTQGGRWPDGAWTWRAEVVVRDGRKNEYGYRLGYAPVAASGPLALCIASLKARSAS